MSIERWFPINFLLPSGEKLQGTVGAGENWQLYDIGHGIRALVVKSELGKRWISKELLDPRFLTEIEFGADIYLLLESENDQQLAPIVEFIAPRSKSDALAFAISMQNSRKIVKNVSFHDAIYVERLSRLLPTWTVSEMVSDENVLGCWLTGGVSVSTSSFRRMRALLGWLDESDVRDVIHSAGLPVPTDVSSARPQRPSGSSQDAIARESSPLADKLGQLRGKKDPNSMGIHDKKFQINGRPILEEFFNEHVIDIILNMEKYKALGVDFPSAIVLYGPPGCGKTFAVERLVEFLDWPAFHIDSTSIGSPYIHEASKKIADIFNNAMTDAPSIIVIDEMEAFLSDRQHTQSSGLHHVEEVAEFLRRIPEATSHEVLVVGMTNRLEMIDSAILRRGRFDHVVEVGMPSKEEVTELVSTLLDKMPIDGKLSLDKAISILTERPLSDAAFVIREAGRMAVKFGKDKIDQDSLNAAVVRLPRASEEEKTRPIGFVWN